MKAKNHSGSIEDRKSDVGRLRFRLAVLALVLLMGGCSTPAYRMERTADGLGLEGHSFKGDRFSLVAYRNRFNARSGRLHVYLDGDGTPWVTRSRVAADPTPRNPLVLRLMALDPAPALYLSRPCYGGQSSAAGCNPWMWTSGRYAEAVVAPMASALRGLVEAQAVSEVVLIGYSGGGVLAWLLAQRIPEVTGLVTIAANLDLDRWTDLHGFSRLDGSLNPAAGPPMRPAVRQLHLVGKADRNVPASIIEALTNQLGPEAKVLFLDSDHRCCWLHFWPEIVRRLP